MPPPSLSPAPTILASWFCPFAQRTLIAANAKKPSLDYTLHEVTFDELYGKPQWFLDLNPQGLIPVIAFTREGADTDVAASNTLPPTSAAAAAAGGSGVVAIRESLVCNEFLEDAYPTPPLLPADPVGKASARLILQRFSDKAVPAFYRMLVQQDKRVQAAAASALDNELLWLVDNMHPQGPLALGPELSLVDAAVAPFLLRLFVLEHYRAYTSYKDGAVGQRLAQYCAALEAHAAVSASQYHPQGLDYRQELLKSYSRYADGSANSLMARDAKKET